MPRRFQGIVRAVRSNDGTSELDPERDYIKQQIRQFIEFVARLLGIEQTAREIEQARMDLATAAEAVLGSPADAFDRLSASSAAGMLQEPERVRAYAVYCAALGELAYREGRLEAAEVQDRRAMQLYRWILDLFPDDPQANQALDGLGRR